MSPDMKPPGVRLMSAMAVVAAVAMVAAACGTAPSPSPQGGSPTAGAQGSPRPSPSTADSPGTATGSGSIPSASTSPATAPTEEPVVAFTQPPQLEPQDEETCLEIVSRQAAEQALGQAVGDIEAQATDPTIQLNCRYAVAAGSGWLQLTLVAGDPALDFDADVAVAIDHGQEPQDVLGIGDRAFYAAATADAPEQVVFTKGPVIVRLWNQTGQAVGQTPLTDLAATAASTIEADIRP